MYDIAANSRVYVDSNIFIYFIENTPKFHSRVESLFEEISRVDATIMTNEIAIAECLYQPAKTRNTNLIRIYESFFEAPGQIEIDLLTGELCKQAALHGGALGLKLIDAIHYFSAFEAGCSHFVTSDTSFKSGPKMKVLLISAD